MSQLLKRSILALSITILSCGDKREKIVYPASEKSEATNTYFGISVAAPYQWLENLTSKKTTSWITAQNKTTNKYLDQIPYKQEIHQRLKQVWNYERYSIPEKEGDYTYYFKNNGLQNQSVLYRHKEGGDASMFLDPNTFSEDGTTALKGTFFSHEASLLAYTITVGGSDWRQVIVISTKDKKQVGDTLRNIKFSSIAWRGNEGFYYSTYKGVNNNRLSDKTESHKLYYHQLNTPQEKDVLIFGGKETKNRYIYAQTTEDQKYLVIYASNSTYGNKLYIRRASAGIRSAFKKVIGNEKNEHSVVYSKGETLWLLTDAGAPNKKLVRFQYTHSSPSKWKTIVPETTMPLSVSTAGDNFFVRYLQDAHAIVKQYRTDGTLVRDISLPGVGRVGGFYGKKKQKSVYFRFANYITPSSIYTYHIESGESQIYRTPKMDFDADRYVSNQVSYQSKDGTTVPMIISYKKDIKQDGTNPLMLYGYGGFNISMLPHFSPANIVWLERGGILAVPNIRGGGEYGNSWHKAGTKLNKQNVFDDFIAAAEYLIREGYTSSKKLAIRGRSNGGLLVGACMTQRPELFRVALPQVGVLDMLKYHQFTAGAGWASDYGTAEESKEMFEALRAYSPVHNVVDTCYPATLISTADYDDRVVPMHSYKFAAELQSHQQCDAPVLIAVQTKSGHGASSTEKHIEAFTRDWSFVWWNMGYTRLPSK